MVCGMSEGKKGLTVKEVVKLFPKFRAKHINYFIKRGVISYPIRDKDLEILVAIYKIWGTKEVVRFNLSYFSKKRKAELFQEALNKCETRFEVWLYTRMMKKIKRGERVYVYDIVREAVRVWKLKRDKKVLESVRKKVKRLKGRLYRSFYRKGKETSLDILV
jgi:hypothetical protein